MARPKTDHNKEDTRIRILRAAEIAFGARGFARTRLEDVAAAAGVRRPSLLHHFGSKGGLYREVVEHAFKDLRARVEGLVEEESHFIELLDQVTTGLVTFSESRPGVAPLVLRELIEPGGAESMVTAHFVPLIDGIEALLVERAGGLVPTGFPVRDAILALFMSHMVRGAMGSGDAALWGEGPAGTATIIRAVMLGAAAAQAATSQNTQGDGS